MLGFRVKVETPALETGDRIEEVWVVGIADSEAAKKAVNEAARPLPGQRTEVLAPLSDWDCDVYRLAPGQVLRLELRVVPGSQA